MQLHGGKTTQIAAITNNNANITACEINQIRLERLRYNIKKQGASSVFVMKKDAKNLDDFFLFDNILLDAPCSGSGIINICDKNLNKYFTTHLIEKSKKSQYILLKKAINILKKGHEMIYSTCSILKEENEDILSKIIRESKIEIIPIEFEKKYMLPILPTKIDGTLCVCPD